MRSKYEKRHRDIIRELKRKEHEETERHRPVEKTRLKALFDFTEAESTRARGDYTLRLSEQK